MKKRMLLLALVAVTLLPAPNCRNLGGTNTNPNGVTLTSITPNPVAVNSAATTITLTGTNFHNGSIAYWNATALVTTYVSTTSLTAVIPAADLTVAGNFSVTVDTSSALTFTVGAIAVGPTPAEQAEITSFFTQVNIIRNLTGLKPLVQNPALNTAAQTQAYYMATVPFNALVGPAPNNYSVALFALQNGFVFPGGQFQEDFTQNQTSGLNYANNLSTATLPVIHFLYGGGTQNVSYQPSPPYPANTPAWGAAGPYATWTQIGIGYNTGPVGIGSWSIIMCP